MTQDNSEMAGKAMPTRTRKKGTSFSLARGAIGDVIRGNLDFVTPWRTWKVMLWVGSASFGTALLINFYAGSDAVAWATLALMLVWLIMVAMPYLNLREAFRDRYTRSIYLDEVIESFVAGTPGRVTPQEFKRLMDYHGYSAHRSWLGAMRGFTSAIVFAVSSVTPFILVMNYAQGWTNPFMLASATTSTLTTAGMFWNLLSIIALQYRMVEEGERDARRALGKDAE
jgi:hypothetical protein